MKKSFILYVTIKHPSQGTLIYIFVIMPNIRLPRPADIFVFQPSVNCIRSELIAFTFYSSALIVAKFSLEQLSQTVYCDIIIDLLFNILYADIP